MKTTSLVQHSDASFAPANAAWEDETSICSAADLLSTVSVSHVKEQQNPVTQAPAKPKKKRIRRQKLELEYLRKLVGKLQQQMTQLKAVPHENKDAAVIKTEGKAPSVWKGIAERQQKERARAEEKNQKLRVSLEGQLKLATNLERLLRKRPREEEVVELAGVKRCKPLVDTTVRPTDDEIFADQLAHVERTHLDADELFGGPEYADRAASFCDLHVMNDPGTDTGVAFVTKASSMLPFDAHVTENLVACSYGLNYTTGSFTTNVRGKQTYRKHVGGDCVIIMWKSLTEPIQINGTKLSGLQCTQVGWIVLRGFNLASDDAQSGYIDTSNVMMSTSLQSYCKMMVELQGDIVDQELQVGALTNFVVNSHDAITDVCGKLLNEVLVEEDWNINGWLDNFAL